MIQRIKSYNTIVLNMATFSSLRMLTGAVSVIYMFQAGVGLDSIAYIKVVQALITLCFGIFIAHRMDGFDRKSMYLISMIASSLWLLMFFLGGWCLHIFYFYIAELFNAIGLVIFNSIYNAYLLDEYFKIEKNKEFESILGKYTNLSFLGMAVFAGIGSIAYQYLGEYLFFAAFVFMVILIINGFLFLPAQKGRHNNVLVSSRKSYEIKLIKRKVLQLLPFIAPLMFVSLFYQVVIQYWQVLASSISVVQQNPYFLGLIFIISLCLQSLAGKLVRHIRVNILTLSFFLILISLLFLSASLRLSNSYFMILGLSLLFFSVRITIILTNAKSHKNITKQIRARFDSFLYVLTTVLSGAGLLISGYFINSYGIQSLIIIGLILMMIAYLSLILLSHNLIIRAIAAVSRYRTVNIILFKGK
ncbi:MAG: MFS transporter [Legionella sp.]|uniref:MFS transporter n=1 Tax=Legionella sp. TaxID=459 RepID=UPI0039E4890C